jgi:hypothetical protein
MDTDQAVIDATAHIVIIQSLTEKLRANYVVPEIADEICARLQQRLDDGEYADITEGEFLAFALTQHMQEVNGDEHLWVRWCPEPLPAHEGQLRHNEEWVAEQRLEAQLENYGLHKAERLPGNVGLLEIRCLHRPAWGGDTAVAAMGFVANASALIIDLRGCTGGYPGMVALLLSYLFGEEPVHLNSMYWRDDDLTQQFWTLPHVPGKRVADTPVYVLISRDTFSGGEEVAYDLQARQRATLVGEKTDGGAHPGASYHLHPHFEAFIPVGRAINPVTGGNWERTGVVPDIPVSAEEALSVAYGLALRSVIDRIGEPASGPLGALLREAQAALHQLESGRPIGT